jgi:hypothetical protein
VTQLTGNALRVYAAGATIATIQAGTATATATITIQVLLHLLVLVEAEVLAAVSTLNNQTLE